MKGIWRASSGHPRRERASSKEKGLGRGWSLAGDSLHCHQLIDVVCLPYVKGIFLIGPRTAQSIWVSLQQRDVDDDWTGSSAILAIRTEIAF